MACRTSSRVTASRKEDQVILVRTPHQLHGLPYGQHGEQTIWWKRTSERLLRGGARCFTLGFAGKFHWLPVCLFGFCLGFVFWFGVLFWFCPVKFLSHTHVQSYKSIVDRPCLVLDRQCSKKKCRMHSNRQSPLCLIKFFFAGSCLGMRPFINKGDERRVATMIVYVQNIKQTEEKHVFFAPCC